MSETETPAVEKCTFAVDVMLFAGYVVILKNTICKKTISLPLLRELVKNVDGVDMSKYAITTVGARVVKIINRLTCTVSVDLSTTKPGLFTLENEERESFDAVVESGVAFKAYPKEIIVPDKDRYLTVDDETLQISSKVLSGSARKSDDSVTVRVEFSCTYKRLE